MAKSWHYTGFLRAGVGLRTLFSRLDLLSLWFRYFRLWNKAPGLEVDDTWGLIGPTPTAKPLGTGGGLRPPPSPVGFAVGGGRLDSKN